MPVIREFKNQGIKFKIISSGQNNISNNYRLLKLSGIEKIDIILYQKKIKQSVSGLFFWFFKTLIRGLFDLKKEFTSLDRRNVFIIIHGDTVSTVIGALIGKFYRLRIAHIEAGLRSFSYFHPFPEEINRMVTSRFADIHFCPNEWAVNNLTKIKGIKVNTYQNTLIDSLEIASHQITESDLLHLLRDQRFFIFVTHRQENIYNKKLINYLLNTIQSISKAMKCVFILHRPTKRALEKYGFLTRIEGKDNIIIRPRLDYFEFIRILEKCEFIITDGGSNQEESYYFGKPCLVLRHKTERVEGLDQNVIISNNRNEIISEFVEDYKKYCKQKIQPKIRPSSIVVNYLIKKFIKTDVESFV